MKALRILLFLFCLSAAGRAEIVSGTRTYNSSIDPTVTNLWLYFAYTNSGRTDVPILVCMHGLGTGSAGAMQNYATAMATQGVFAVAIGMRGGAGASGDIDYSGREIYDIYDGVVYCRTAFASVASSTKLAVMGISGGGGNTLAFASKFPDAAHLYSDYFGISDYTGWPSSQETNFLRARMSRYAITNLTSGFLYLWHNTGDITVPIANSYNVTNSMFSAGRTNYQLTTSATLYPHESPTFTLDSQDVWLAAITNGLGSVWTVPASGSVRVLGYIVTKRFSIWLGGGTNQVADVSYNATTGTYVVTPVTSGSIDVALTQGYATITTNISAQTTLQLSFTPRMNITGPVNITGGNWSVTRQ